MSRPERVYRDANEVEHHRRHVQHVVCPIAPPGQKSVEIAKNFFGPEINAAFPRIAVSQFDDCDALRPEEQQQGDDPEPNSHAAICSNRRHDVQIKNGYDKEQHQVPAA